MGSTLMGLDIASLENCTYTTTLAGGTTTSYNTDLYRYDYDYHMYNRHPRYDYAGFMTNQSMEEVINLYKPKKKTMSIVDKIKLAMKPEPEKTLIKAGILDENEDLTCDGRKILEMILVDVYKDKLKEKADIILAETSKK